MHLMQNQNQILDLIVSNHNLQNILTLKVAVSEMLAVIRMSSDTLKELVNSVRPAGLKKQYCLGNQQEILATHWIRYKH